MSMLRVLTALTILMLLPLSEAVAQRSYSGNTLGCVAGVPDVNSQDLNADRGLGVCDEAGIHPLRFEPGSSDLGTIDFFIRSCWSWYYSNPCQTGLYGRYSVEVSATDRGDFYLTGSSGDSIKVRLEFEHPSRPPEPLVPGEETNTLYPGVTNYQAGPVSLRVFLAPGESLVDDSYSGTFDLLVYQCEWWDYQPKCKNAPGQGGGPALLAQPFRLQAGLNPDTLIRISGLEDMVLDGSGSGDISAEQTFCVFTTDSAEFNIRGDSLNGDGGFWLRGETINDDVIPYEVSVEHVGNPRRPKSLREGRVARKWPGANQENCGGQENMKILVAVNRADMGDPRDARYQDILTLTVAAE